MVFCSTADLAMHGLRLNVDQPIPVGTPVGVTVIFRSPAHHFRHVGKVRWLKNDESVASYTVGIEFAPKSNADMYAWREFLEATFPDVLANPADS